MIEPLLAVVILLVLVAIILLVLLLRRAGGEDLRRLTTLIESSQALQDRTERGLREEIARNREETAAGARHLREELTAAFKSFTEQIHKQMTESAAQQRQQMEAFSARLAELTRVNEERLNAMRELMEKKLDAARLSVDERLKLLQEDNGKRLDLMRATVDEKLQGTLEKRLGESFKLVSERLEQVHKGLGEMQTLANGVGDLKRVLTNVKTRGNWGEVQLGALLEQVLTPEQYGANVATREGSSERVEFAVRLPGRDDGAGEVLLPIDAKFPQEDYQRLIEAQEKVDPVAADEAARQLDLRVKACAKDIRDKYLNPPRTTDFGIMFLPTEGLYAEVARRTGLIDIIQREYRVIIAGPTTLLALLNSLQMGFRTLAIQKQSGEVWKVLGEVKTEFGKYGDVLGHVQKKLQEASNTIDRAETRTRAIERKLRKVQELPAAADDALPLLPDGDTPDQPRFDPQTAEPRP